MMRKIQIVILLAVVSLVSCEKMFSDIDNTKWYQAKTVIGRIKNACDVYFFKQNGFSELMTDDGATIADKTAIPVNTIEKNIGLGAGSLAGLQPFSASDFKIAFDMSADAPAYHIFVIFTENGNPPSASGYNIRGVHKKGAFVTWYKTNSSTATEQLPAKFESW